MIATPTSKNAPCDAFSDVSLSIMYTFHPDGGRGVSAFAKIHPSDAIFRVGSVFRSADGSRRWRVRDIALIGPPGDVTVGFSPLDVDSVLQDGDELLLDIT